HDAYPQQVQTGRSDARCQRRLQQVTRTARIPAQDHRRTPAIRLAVGRQHGCSTAAQAEGQLGGETVVGHAPHAVGAKQPAHTRPSFGANSTYEEKKETGAWSPTPGPRSF